MESCLLLVEGDELHLLLSEFYAAHDHGAAQNDTVVTSEWACEFLYAPGPGSGQPSPLCLGSAGFCSGRTGKPPSPDPLEGWPAPSHRAALASPPWPLLALLVESGKALVDLCVSVLPLGRTGTAGDLGWVRDLLLPLSAPGDPKGRL